MKVIPILFDDMGKPKDVRLYEAVCLYYAKTNIGAMPDLSKFMMVWATVDGGVIGLMGMQASPDLTIFHSDDSRAYAKMYNRVHDWCEDRGVKSLLVHMTDSESPHVQSLIEHSNAEPADRWLFHAREED